MSETASEATESVECKHCETTIEADDLAYRVVYGDLEDLESDTIAEKVVGRADEELDHGAIERYWCFDCYHDERRREKGAHYHYENANELWSILEGADGRLVADAKAMTVGGRGWFRVVDGAAQARHSVAVKSNPDSDYDLRFATEPTPEFDRDDFDQFFAKDHEIKLVYLKPVEETPFVSGMNRTLGADYAE